MTEKDRFSAIYHLSFPQDLALKAAEEICIEQTIEFPPDLVEDLDILENIMGKVRSFEHIDDELFRAKISFPSITVGSDLTQLINVLFGNTSLKPGIRLVDVELCPEMEKIFPGPRFGIQGIRELVGAKTRPLFATALKPMGCSPVELADLAEKFALGGIDIIKDDHGLTDQSFCPFEERVKRCAEAVAEVNAKTGRKCLYFPNITAPIAELPHRAQFAREAGAGGLVISPGLAGFDSMLSLSSTSGSAQIPVMSHPAFQGAFTINPTSGVSHRVIYGQLARIAGADATIFPSYGGRFSFTREECQDLVRGTSCEMGSIRTIFPVPAGGMSLERVPQMVEFYGSDVVLLIGGDLRRHGTDLVQNCRTFIESSSSSSHNE